MSIVFILMVFLFFFELVFSKSSKSNPNSSIFFSFFLSKPSWPFLCFSYWPKVSSQQPKLTACFPTSGRCRTAPVRRARTASFPAHPSSVAGSLECLLAVLEQFISRAAIRFFVQATSSPSTFERHTSGILPPLASRTPCPCSHAPVCCAGARAAHYP
jgi:hypothetical protein